MVEVPDEKLKKTPRTILMRMRYILQVKYTKTDYKALLQRDKCRRAIRSKPSIFIYQQGTHYILHPHFQAKAVMWAIHDDPSSPCMGPFNE